MVGWAPQVAIKRRGRVDSNFVLREGHSHGISFSLCMVARG